MSQPLADLITWTTYGTWLPGDGRGWVRENSTEIERGDHEILTRNRDRLKQPPVVLSNEQRQIVHKAIQQHCEIRRWTLHALNVRTNHVHVVVTADVAPEIMMNQFKAWCSRRLNEMQSAKQRWWTKHGSTKWINGDDYLQNAIRYVEDQ